MAPCSPLVLKSISLLAPTVHYVKQQRWASLSLLQRGKPCPYYEMCAQDYQSSRHRSSRMGQSSRIYRAERFCMRSYYQASTSYPHLRYYESLASTVLIIPTPVSTLIRIHHAHAIGIVRQSYPQ